MDHETKFWLMECVQIIMRKSLRIIIKKPISTAFRLFCFSLFSLLASWDVKVVAKTWAAILEHEMTWNIEVSTSYPTESPISYRIYRIHISYIEYITYRIYISYRTPPMDLDRLSVENGVCGKNSMPTPYYQWWECALLKPQPAEQCWKDTQATKQTLALG